MIPLPPTPLLALVQESASSGREREFYRQYSALMLVLALLCIIAITALAFIVTQRRARRRKDALPKPRNAPNTDAWAEAGRRLDGEYFEIRDDPKGGRGKH